MQSPTPDREVIVLTWKPEINPDFKEKDFDALATSCWRNGHVDVHWRFLSDRFHPNDPVVVLRQGKEPGLIAVGLLLSLEPATDSAADRSLKGLVRLTKMRDSHEHPLFSKRELLEMGFRKSVLETQASGSLSLLPEEQVSFEAALAEKFSINLFGGESGRLSPDS